MRSSTRIYLRAKLNNNAKDEIDSMLVKIPSIENALKSLVDAELRVVINVEKDTSLILKISVPSSKKKDVIDCVPSNSNLHISKDKFIRIPASIALKKNLPW